MKRMEQDMFEYFKGTGGRVTYGVTIGIISSGTVFPRIPGDSGNASTYTFPVAIKITPGRRPIERIVKRDPQLLREYIKAVREFEKIGVRAITTTCGFNILFQEELAKASSVPVFSSSLLQLPVVQRMLPKGKKIGIITADSKIFHEYRGDLLSCAGVEPSTPIVIGGTENILNWKPFLDQERIEKEVVKLAKKMVAENPDIGAIQFECHNLPPYGKAVQDATGLSVFDIQTLVDMVYGAIVKKRYTGLM